MGEFDDDEPTAFPADRLFPPEVEAVLKMFEGKPSEEDLVAGMEMLQDLHEMDRQWVEWPRYADEARKNKYANGLFRLMRGVLRCVKLGQGDVCFAAVDLLASLLTGGSAMTRLKPNFLVQCGGISALCRVASGTGDSQAINILTELSRNASASMLPSIISGGAPRAAVELLTDPTSEPMDQLAALDLLSALAKRAPAKVAQAGAYEAVMNIANPALAPRRNKIMSLLRPIVRPGDEDTAPATTNIKVGGLKF